MPDVKRLRLEKKKKKKEKRSALQGDNDPKNPSWQYIIGMWSLSHNHQCPYVFIVRSIFTSLESKL